MRHTNKYHVITLLSTMTVAMSACTSDDQVSEVNDINTNRISYGVTTENISRTGEGATVYTHINVPDNFYVWAYYSRTDAVATYFDADKVTRTGLGAGGWTGKGSKYWPGEKALNFYALAGLSDSEIDFGYNDNGGVGGSYEVYPYVTLNVPIDQSQQRDLLYAVKTNQTRPGYTNGEADANVNLDFRHALVQVEFKAHVDNPQLIVEIKEIAIHNIADRGRFFLPLGDTDLRAGTTPANDDVFSNFDYESYGSWTVGDYTPTTYTATFDGGDRWGAYITYGQTATATSPLLMIPTDIYQETSHKWRDTDQRPTDEQVYFSMKCRIYRIPGRNIATGETGSDIALWSEDTDLIIPADLVWEDKQGHKITYTFDFGDDNNGSYYGDPTRPLDIEISYTANMTDWVEAGLNR